MNVLSFNEISTIENYFKLAPKSNEREHINKSLNTKNYVFICYLEIALIHLIYIEKITDPVLLKKLVFRYAVLMLYFSYETTKYPFFYSQALTKIKKESISLEILKNELSLNEDDLWGNIFNNSIYNNEIKKAAKNYEKKVSKDALTIISRISSILYKQQNYFSGDKPLFNTTNENMKNIVLIDELICNILNKNEFYIAGKQGFSFSFINEEKWRDFLDDDEHEVADLKMLAFILKDAITQRKLSVDDYIDVESQNYYRAIAGIKNGSYSQINLLKIVKGIKNLVQINYSLIDEPLYFEYNNLTYYLTSSGIEEINN